MGSGRCCIYHPQVKIIDCQRVHQIAQRLSILRSNFRISHGFDDCMSPAGLGPSPLMIFDVNLWTKFGRSPWGSIHAFSQWDDKMPFLRIKLHSLQLKKGIEGKEQKLLEARLDFTLLVRLLTLVGAPCRECRYSIWRLLPHSHLKRCLRWRSLSDRGCRYQRNREYHRTNARKPLKYVKI